MQGIVRPYTELYFSWLNSIVHSLFQTSSSNAMTFHDKYRQWRMFVTSEKHILSLDSSSKYKSIWKWGEMRWIGSLTSQLTILQSYMWRYRCAGGLKKLYLRSGSQPHRHFAWFLNVPVQAPTRDQPFYPRATRCGWDIVTLCGSVRPSVRPWFRPYVDLVNTIETKPLHISLSNLADMLTMMRGWTLLILEVRGQGNNGHIWK